eukprot:scaffold133971_cov33-Tisochrysis_lutea.AAC.2
MLGLITHIVVPHGVRSDGIFRAAEQQVHRRFTCANLDRRLKGAKERRSSTHVRFHSAHPLLGLERKTASVINDALTDECHGSLSSRRSVAQDGQRGGLNGATTDGMYQAVPGP